MLSLAYMYALPAINFYFRLTAFPLFAVLVYRMWRCRIEGFDPPFAFTVKKMGGLNLAIA
jgi:hypothetical protein